MSYSRILVVTTPATDTLLVSLDVAKDELGITDASQDERLTRWIKEASALIVGYIGRPLRLESVTETLRANSYTSEAPGEHFYPRVGAYPSGAYNPQVPGISLRRYPIVALTSITEDTVSLDPAADFEVDADYGIVYRLSGTCRVPWYGQVEVISYSGGYATADDVPDDIQTGCLMLLKYRKSAQLRDPLLRQVSIPGVIEKQYETAGARPGGETSILPPEVERFVCRYRDVHL